MISFKKTHKNTLIWAGLTAVAFLAVSGQAWAQGSPGNGGPTPTDIPIDGGISLLVAGGVAIGVNKLRKLKRNRTK